MSRVDGVMLRVGALESESRAAQNLDFVARVRALEAVQYHSNKQTQPRAGQSSSQFCDVGGFGPLSREAASAKVNSAIGLIDGFVKVVVDRIGAVPKVVVCEFSSYASMMAPVTN